MKRAGLSKSFTPGISSRADSRKSKSLLIDLQNLFFYFSETLQIPLGKAAEGPLILKMELWGHLGGTVG